MCAIHWRTGRLTIVGYPERQVGVVGVRATVMLINRLVKDYDIHFVSTGDVLRKEIMAKSEVGKRAEEVVASGGGFVVYGNKGVETNSVKDLYRTS